MLFIGFFCFTDVFHWVCLDKWARSLPANTAPAGYTCPTCQECIFPHDKLVSPVADALRKILSDVNWARPGLGLPLLEERVERKPHFSDIPSGPRPAPEGESMTSLGGMTDGRPMGLNVKKDTLIQVNRFVNGETKGGHVTREVLSNILHTKTNKY